MAVLVEGISVVVRRDAIVRAFGPEWATFVAAVPNQTLCADPEIARVGFMHPDDVKAYVERLGAHGMVHLRDGAAMDLVVIDQLRGLLSPCDWLEFGRTGLTGANDVIGVARLKGTSVAKIALPIGWTYPGSLSARFTFVPNASVPEMLEKVGHEDGVDVLRDRESGKRLFMGRTAAAEPSAPSTETSKNRASTTLWQRLTGKPKA